MKQLFLVIGLTDTTTITDCQLSSSGIKKEEEFLIRAKLIQETDSIIEAMEVAKAIVSAGNHEYVEIKTVLTATK